LENTAAGTHSKGGKAGGGAFFVQALCMLDTVGKVLERIIHSRLEGALLEFNGLSEMQ